MRYAIFEIKEHRSYAITIGSREKPDSQFRDLVTGQINRAMESFTRDKAQGHKISVIHDWETADSGASDLSEIPGHGQYLIFALRSSEPGTGNRLSEEELMKYGRELELMFGSLLGDTKAAHVLLQDCTVNVIEIAPGEPFAGSLWVDVNPIYDNDNPQSRGFWAGNRSKWDIG